jgi:hypothetical protein
LKGTAMKIQTEDIIDYPIQMAFTTMRDKLLDLAKFMPNVQKIEEKSREDVDANRVKFLNIWHGKASIPTVAQAIIKPEMLNWKDYAEWDASNYSCKWKIELNIDFLKNNVTCAGTNTFEAVGENRTRIKINGDLDIKVDAIPGVPKFLSGSLKSTIEKFIVNLITPNLANISKSVKSYLDSKK